jgi:hypothetical protein
MLDQLAAADIRANAERPLLVPGREPRGGHQSDAPRVIAAGWHVSAETFPGRRRLGVKRELVLDRTGRSENEIVIENGNLHLTSEHVRSRR